MGVVMLFHTKWTFCIYIVACYF